VRQTEIRKVQAAKINPGASADENGCSKRASHAIMPYEYLDHKADRGIKVIAPTREALMSDAAQALFNLIYDTNRVTPCLATPVNLESESLEVLIVDFLNHILSIIDISDHFFHHCDNIFIRESNGKVMLTCLLWGETYDKGKHTVKTEVKAATYSGLKLEFQNGIYTFQCLLDV
jgi:SHS2 domain-containing protein